MDFDRQAQQWDDRPDRAERSRRVADAVRGALDLSRRPATIELGAGTGPLSRQLADTLGPVTLTDTSAGMIDVARRRIVTERRNAWRALVVDPDAATLPGGPYALVLSQLALHHMPDPALAMQAAYGGLCAGGHIAIVDLDKDPDGAFHAGHVDFHGPHGFARADVESWLRAAGFVDVRIRTATVVDKVVRDETRDFPLWLATGRRPI